MLKTKEQLATRITNICKRNVVTPKFAKEAMIKLEEQYNIPASISSSIVTLKTETIYENEFILYCVLSVIDSDQVKNFFTDKEIESYSKTKYKTKRVKFPIKLRMIQQSDDSWIGATTVKELMSFRDAQLINYNENTQRTLKRIISGDAEYYQIDLNKTAVMEISELFKSGKYIPDVIILNMPETTEFEYDGEYLIIKELDAFDIIDGYHRYMAMSNVYNNDKKFDYSMGLEVVCYSEEKACELIYQHDQKTKMSKVNSDSFNQNSPANQVTQMLNQKGILSGMITRNKGIIEAPEFSKQVSILYFNSSKKYVRSDMVKVRDEIYHRIEAMADNQPDILDKRWKTNYMICAMALISNEDVSDEDLVESINKLYSAVSKEENKNIIGNQVSKVTYTRLAKLYEELK